MQTFQEFLDATIGPPYEELHQYDPEIFCFKVIGKQCTCDVAGFCFCLTLSFGDIRNFINVNSLNKNWLHNALISAK